MKIVKKILDYITQIEYFVMIVAFIVMVISYFISVVNRNFIKASVPWTEELAMYSMVYLALLGTEVGLRDGTQAAVTAVVERFHGIPRKIIDLVKQVIVEIFSFFMCRSGWALVQTQFKMGQTTPVLKVPMGFMYFALVLAFGIIFLVQLVTLIEMIMNLPKKEGEEA